MATSGIEATKVKSRVNKKINDTLKKTIRPFFVSKLYCIYINTFSSHSLYINKKRLDERLDIRLRYPSEGTVVEVPRQVQL